MPADLTAWFDGLVPLPRGANEQLYCQAWCDQVAQGSRSEFSLAVQGGWLAENLSQVFIAGYQAAIRKTFPQVEWSGIAAFAVSEDRSDTNPLPGVVWHPHAEGILLSGYKTWVAAIAQVEQLIVKARGEQAGQSGFFLVPAKLDRVHLDVHPSPSRLPDLSQGRAFLDEVVLPAASSLDPGGVAGFGRNEALMIYAAFLAMVWRRTADASLEKTTAAGILRKLEQCFASPDAPVDVSAVDKSVQNLRQQLADGQWASDQTFLRDQSLIAMYSRGLRNH